MNNTRIVRYAAEHDLCVVMPSADNSYYVDQPESHNLYAQYVGRELVRITRCMFPLSRRREDTFIGGLSMGGFGALCCGLRFADTFGGVVALSPALLTEETMPEREAAERRAFYSSIFGDLSQIGQHPSNPRLLAEALIAGHQPLPRLYFACGEQDKRIMDWLESFLTFLDQQGIDYRYEHGSGGHDWNFWDAYIRRAMDWM